MTARLRSLAAVAALVLCAAAPAHADVAADSVRGTLRYTVRGLSAVQGGFFSGGVQALATGVGLQQSALNMVRLLTGLARVSGNPSFGEMETFLRSGKGFDLSSAPVSAGADVTLDFLLVSDGGGVYRLRSGTARYSGNTDSDLSLSSADGNNHRFTDLYRGEGSASLTPENADITLTVTGRGDARRAELEVNVAFPVTVTGKTTWSAMGGLMVISLEERGDARTWRMSAFGQQHSQTESHASAPNAGVVYHRSGPLDSVLSGRETWQDLADSGVLVQWSLGRPLRGDVELAIAGPACGCLDGEKVPGAQVTWTAEPSERGGTFAPFTVQAAGKAPRVVENRDGRLVLEPTRETGVVTLVASYTHGGRTTTATRTVSFCVIDSVRVADGERDFAFDDAAPGVLFVPNARTRAAHDGADATGDIVWTFQRIGPPGETTMAPAQLRGGNVNVTYTGLPALNGAFGQKRIEARVRRGACDCARTSSFRAFYSPTAANHPQAGADALGEQPVPNWFYYMSQTSAMRGIPRLAYARQRTSSEGVPAIGQFDERSGIVYLTGRLWQVGCTPPVPRGRPVSIKSARGGNTGIDCVAETARHEDQHRREDGTWWSGDYSLVSDPDLDRVPSSVEERLPGCSGTRAKSCTDRPFVEVSDREITAYWTGWAWPRGAASSEDWACGPLGKQWGRGVNCAE